MALVIGPFAIIVSVVVPLLLTSPVAHIIIPVTLILVESLVDHFSVPLPLALYKVAFKPGSVVPFQQTFSMEKVIFEFAFVLIAAVLQGSLASHFIFFKRTFVDSLLACA